MVESRISDQVAKFRQRRTAPLILELDLTEGIIEERPADPLSAVVLARRRLLLADVLDGLRPPTLATSALTRWSPRSAGGLSAWPWCRNCGPRSRSSARRAS